MFQLTKTWVDQEPGIEMVEIRYTWTPLGGAAKWEGQEETEVMTVVPNTNPRLRQGVIEIPRLLPAAKDGRSAHLCAKLIAIRGRPTSTRAVAKL